MTRTTKLLALLALFSTPLFAADPAPATPPYTLARALHLGGEGRWDYVTFAPDSKLLYVPRSTHTLIVDPNADDKKGKVVADIPDTAGVHGVALVPELSRGFTSNGKDGTVTIFDLKTYKTLGKIKAVEDVDCIIYDPFSRRVLAFSGDSQSVVPIPADIDPQKGIADPAVELEGAPEYAVADAKGHVYVNIVDKSQIVDLDTTPVKDGKPIKVANRWPLAPGEHPTGLSLDPATHHLFAGCRNKTLVVLDADSGKVLKTFPIGTGVDATAFDSLSPTSGLILASCGDGSLYVIQSEGSDSFTPLPAVPTVKGARTMALDPATHTVYLPASDMGPTPAVTAADPRPRPAPVAGTFRLLVLEKK